MATVVDSAGRDPAYWDEPDRFEITRKVSGQIGYGVGVHGWVAQMMARLEGEGFFQTLAERTADLESDGPAVLRLNPGLRGLESLPITLTPKAA